MMSSPTLFICIHEILLGIYECISGELKVLYFSHKIGNIYLYLKRLNCKICKNKIKCSTNITCKLKTFVYQQRSLKCFDFFYRATFKMKLLLPLRNYYISLLIFSYLFCHIQKEKRLVRHHLSKQMIFLIPENKFSRL